MSELREKIAAKVFSALWDAPASDLPADWQRKVYVATDAILATLALDYARGYAAAREDAARVADAERARWSGLVAFTDAGAVRRAAKRDAAAAIAAAIRALEPKP